MNFLLPTGTDHAAIAKAAIAFRSQFAPALLIAAGVALVALAWWSYRRRDDDLARWQRALLASARAAFLLLVLLILARPVLVLTLESSASQTLALLCDTSASMGIQDAGTTSRLERVQSLLTNPKLDLLAQLERDYDLRPFVFGRTLSAATGTNDADWVARLKPSGNATALGDAVRDALSAVRGQPLAGMVILTDGGNNIGSPPLDAAALARQENAPLYIHGIGSVKPKDVVVSAVVAPELAFVNDEVSVAVHLRGIGLSGRSAPVTLMLGERFIAQQSVTFSNDAEQVVTMKFTPRDKGVFDLTAAVAPLPDELVKDNNARSKRLRVLDSKIKVLLIEQSPRWEFRYLLATLQRDRRLDLKCVLFEGDPGIARGENSPFLEKFPARKEDLFAYDLILLGDVDPTQLKPDQLNNLGRFVSDFGGALVVIAGRHFMPEAYRKTVMEKLLPVELDGAVATDTGDKPIALDLTTDGKTNPMLRLAEDELDNAVRWRSLPPVYWVCPVGRAKPGAETLLTADDKRKMPVLATHQYGSGRVLFVGTDNTWRWRKNSGESYFTTFWSQIVQRMSLLRLLGSQKRIQISLNRQTANVGDRLTVHARVYTTEFEPVKDATVRGFYADRVTGQSPVEVQLRAAPDQPGMFRGEFLPRAPGAFKFYLDRDANTAADFDVTEPRLEFADIAMNAGLLREMAAASGGRFLTDTQMPHLPEIIGRRAERIASTKEIDLWSSPLYLALLLAVVTAEWILRKLWQLK